MRVLSIVLVALCVACGSDTAPATGAAHIQILSGNNQTSIAGRHVRLTQDVTGQLYRKADGALAFRWIEMALPTNLFAQATPTTVPGGLPGQETCWADVPGHPRLIPFSVCVNTQANGLVTYTVYNDTIAGDAQGEVHVDSAGHPIVTAVVSATILAGPVWSGYRYGPGPTLTLPAVVSDSSVKDQYGNPIPFRIVDPSGQLILADTTFGSVGGRTIVSGPDGQTAPNGDGFVVELQDVNGALLGHARYRISARLNQLVQWSAVGLATTP